MSENENTAKAPSALTGEEWRVLGNELPWLGLEARKALLKLAHYHGAEALFPPAPRDGQRRR